MKKTIKFIAILALLAIGFTSCHKDNNDELMGKIHKARYEVVSLGEEEAELSLIYITQKGVGYCNGLTTVNEIATTPWQHEFTFYYDSFSFEAVVDLENEYGDEYTPIKILLYIDDELVAEQQNENHSYIIFTYFFNE